MCELGCGVSQQRKDLRTPTGVHDLGFKMAALLTTFYKPHVPTWCLGSHCFPLSSLKCIPFLQYPSFKVKHNSFGKPFPVTPTYTAPLFFGCYSPWGLVKSCTVIDYSLSLITIKDHISFLKARAISPTILSTD